MWRLDINNFRKFDDDDEDGNDFEAELAMMDEIESEMSQEMDVDETGKTQVQ